MAKRPGRKSLTTDEARYAVNARWRKYRMAKSKNLLGALGYENPTGKEKALALFAVQSRPVALKMLLESAPNRELLAHECCPFCWRPMYENKKIPDFVVEVFED